MPEFYDERGIPLARLAYCSRTSPNVGLKVGICVPVVFLYSVGRVVSVRLHFACSTFGIPAFGINDLVT